MPSGICSFPLLIFFPMFLTPNIAFTRLHAVVLVLAVPRCPCLCPFHPTCILLLDVQSRAKWLPHNCNAPPCHLSMRCLNYFFLCSCLCCSCSLDSCDLFCHKPSDTLVPARLQRSSVPQSIDFHGLRVSLCSSTTWFVVQSRAVRR